jgi:hypothetical protein
VIVAEGCFMVRCVLLEFVRRLGVGPCSYSYRAAGDALFWSSSSGLAWPEQDLLIDVADSRALRSSKSAAKDQYICESSNLRFLIISTASGTMRLSLGWVIRPGLL